MEAEWPNSRNGDSFNRNDNPWLQFSSVGNDSPNETSQPKKHDVEYYRSVKLPFDVDSFATSGSDIDFGGDYWDYGKLYYDFNNLPVEERDALLVQAKPIDQLKYLSLLATRMSNSGGYAIPGMQDPLGVRGLMELIQNDKKAAPLVRIAAKSLDGLIGEYSDILMDGFNFTEWTPEEEKQERARRNFQRKIIDFSRNQDRDTRFLIGVVYDDEFPLDWLIKETLKVDLTKMSMNAQAQLLKFMAKANNERFDNLTDTMNKLSGNLRLKLAENFVAADFGEDFGDSLLEIASSEHLTDKEKAQILDNMSSCRKSIGVIAGWYKGLDKGVFTRQYTRAANERLTDIITVFREIAKKGAITADSGRGERITFDYESAIEALKYETKSLEIISGTVQDVADGKNGAFAEVVVPPDKSHSSTDRTVYNLYSPNHGYILLHTRPEGTHSFDPQLEYGKVGSRYNSNSVNTGTEASISFMANPVEPFSLPTPFKNLPWYKQDNLRLRGEKSDIDKAADNYKRNRVSAIRLDREGIPLGAPANDPNRDPVAPQGRVSVDLSSIGDKPNTPSGKIARLITVGNMVRAKERGSNEIYLNHNTKWFDKKYGTTDGFKRLVNHIDTLMCGDGRTYPGLVGLRPPAEGERLIKKWEELERQPESGDQEHVQTETDILLGGQIETATKRQKNQRRGKKAMKTTDLLKKMSRPVPSLDTPNPSNTPDTSGPDVA